jgi:hypothetical protein
MDCSHNAICGAEAYARRKWWQKSLYGAERLDARWELDITHLEMGARLQNPAHLEYTEAILTEIRAGFDAAQARACLQRIRGQHAPEL